MLLEIKIVVLDHGLGLEILVVFTSLTCAIIRACLCVVFTTRRFAARGNTV